MLDSVVFNLPMRYCTCLMIDGRYRGYEDKEALSTDGSRELVLDYQKKYGKERIQLWDKPNEHERFKRDYYLRLASQQQIPFVCICDSDEWLDCKSPLSLLDEIRAIHQAWLDRESYTEQYPPIAGIEKVPRISNVHMINCVDKDNDGYIVNAVQRPRLWYRPEDMHYTTKHYYWVSKQVPEASEGIEGNKRVLAQTAVGMKSFVIHNLQMFHSHDMRSEDRERKRIIYEREKLPRLES